jgi:murein tripeptide amidase MpaA
MKTPYLAAVWPVLLALAATPNHAAGRPGDDTLATTAELSGFTRTGRYAEVERLCKAYAVHWPAQVRCFEFGTSPQGRAMWALAASSDGTFDPNLTRSRGRPVVLLQGGIHAGEIDGKDAGFSLLRRLLSDHVAAASLGKVTVLFVPIYNVDGHERFGAWNRPNQRGPEAMGWRTTAQNYNLNRDYMKADAPETIAMQGLLNAWDPMVYADLHVTDGADFQHDISITAQPTENADGEIARGAAALRDEIVGRLHAAGSLPLTFYPAFVRDDDPSSGVAVAMPPSNRSHAYRALANRMALLVETHSWKDYATRVRLTAATISALVDIAARDGAAWLAAAAAADRRAGHLGGTQLALAFENTPHITPIDFLGYAYERRPSAISGALVTHYDPAKKTVWHMPLRDELRPTLFARIPQAGYIVPAAVAAWLAPKLRAHGLVFEVIENSRTSTAVEAWRAHKTSFAAQSFEGHVLLKLDGEWHPETQDIEARSLFVPAAQPKVRLAVALLDPTGPDSYAAWGFFNTAFERKEYMEAYVAEKVAEDMLQKDPALRREFEKQLDSDAEFARDPAARLDFFYSRHASWDKNYNLYPVLRVEHWP